MSLTWKGKKGFVCGNWLSLHLSQMPRFCFAFAYMRSPPPKALGNQFSVGKRGRQPLRGRLGAPPGPLASRSCGDVGERWKCPGNGKEERKSRIKDGNGKFILLYHPIARKKKTLVLSRLMSVRCWLERPGQGRSLPQVWGDSSYGEKILLCIELKSACEGLHLIVLSHQDLRNSFSLMPLPQGSP